MGKVKGCSKHSFQLPQFYKADYRCFQLFFPLAWGVSQGCRKLTVLYGLSVPARQEEEGIPTKLDPDRALGGISGVR